MSFVTGMVGCMNKILRSATIVLSLAAAAFAAPAASHASEDLPVAVASPSKLQRSASAVSIAGSTKLKRAGISITFTIRRAGKTSKRTVKTDSRGRFATKVKLPASSGQIDLIVRVKGKAGQYEGSTETGCLGS